jgi:hypothetical protein
MNRHSGEKTYIDVVYLDCFPADTHNVRRWTNQPVPGGLFERTTSGMNTNYPKRKAHFAPYGH